jgi:hypothetical protein
MKQDSKGALKLKAKAVRITRTMLVDVLTNAKRTKKEKRASKRNAQRRAKKIGGKHDRY